MEKVDLLSARGKSLGFTDTEIFCGLFSSSSCQCLFNSEGTVPLASHQVGRFPDRSVFFFFPFKLHGAAYGKGIYLSPISSISFGYSGTYPSIWEDKVCLFRDMT